GAEARGDRADALVDPDLRIDAPHAVDEQHGGGWLQAGLGRHRRPPVVGDVLGGRSPEIGVDAAAVARVPRVDRELHSPSRVTDELRWSRETTNRTGTRSARAGTWVITPTIRSPRAARVSRVPATVSRLASSRVPNPSSRKIDSSRAAPWAASPDICAESANASARLAWKVSPPERVFTGLRASASVWSTTRNSPFSWVSSNWPPESSARLTDASATSASSADATSHRGKPSERRRWPSIFATCWASTAASRSAVSLAAAARRSTTRACAPRARATAVAAAVAATPE